MTRRTSAPRGLYCPVCGNSIAFIWIWQHHETSRIRMFCGDCCHLDEYRPLPKGERAILSYECFQRFAARRLLAHVREKELARRQGERSDG